MGLFRLLFGKKEPTKVEILPELVYLTREAKFRAVGRDLEGKSHSRSIALLLIAHFDDVEEELQRLLEDYSGDVPAMVVRADELSSDIAAKLNADESAIIDLLVPERHPLVSEGDRVLNNFAEDLPCRCMVTYYVSMDDPLMRMFAGDFVRSVMEKLGMGPDEAIESGMVQRRIRTAQNKISRVATGNRPARTSLEWMELNVPHDG